MFCLAPLSSIAGIFCGHLARRELRRNPALRGSGFATTGLIVGYICTTIFAGMVMLFLILPGTLLLRAPNVLTAITNAPDEIAFSTDSPASKSPPAPDVALKPGRNPTRPAEATPRRKSPEIAASNRSASGKIAQPLKPVTGRIGGGEFTCEAATLNNSFLILRQGKDFLADAEVQVMLFAPGSLEGKTIVVDPSSRFGMTPHLNFKWKNSRATKPSRSKGTSRRP